MFRLQPRLGSGKVKFIHLSDIHILPRPQTIRDIDVCARLDAAVNSICTNFSDAAFCMVTGDLSDRGESAAYFEGRAILDRLPMPWYPLLGNHDDRAIAQASLGEAPWHADGFLQYDFQTEAGQFIVLDSLTAGDGGHLCEKRLGWLRDRLEAAKSQGRKVFIFMHHVPFDIGIPWLDGMKMENGEQMFAILQEFSHIRHMFFGHVHRPVHGSWQGIPFSTVRGCVHQAALRFGRSTPEFIAENPAYGVVLIDENQVIIHDHSFLDEHLPIVR